MDTVTHGIVGALLGKAFFADRHATEFGGAEAARIATYTATLSSVFSDMDVIAGPLTRNDFAVIEIHRGVTHSLLCLPVWAAGIAALALWYARRRGVSSFTWSRLWLIAAIGLGSHLLLDLVTSFGTMIWSPWSRTRAAWDTVFIIDLAVTAIALLPQLLTRVYRKREGSLLRAVRLWAVSSAAFFLFALVSQAVGFALARWSLLAVPAVLAVLCFAPARGWGLSIGRAGWCRTGVYALAFYLLLCAGAHHLALRRVAGFAEARGMNVAQIAALPLPPSMAHWDALVRTPEGVWEARINLFKKNPVEFHFYVDAAPNGYLDAARKLPRVQAYLEFARFPLYRFREDGGRPVVEISDLRFFARGSRPAPFTYRVAFDGEGRVIEQGWVRIAP